MRFTGASAKAVAEKHVGIGDSVILGLEGARWEEDRERNKTPGKSVEGELVFGRRVGLGLWRAGDGGMQEQVDVDVPLSPPVSAGQGQEVLPNGDAETEAFTPAPAPPRASNDLLRRSLEGSFTDGGWTYSSPAFAKRVRLSGEGSFLDSAFDPFIEGAELASPTKSKRTSFGTGLRWRLKSRTPSPVKEGFGEVGVDGMEVDGEVIESPSRRRIAGEMVRNVVTTAADAEVEEMSFTPDDEGGNDVLEIEPVKPLPQPAISASAIASEQTTTPTPVVEVPVPDMPPPSLPRLSIPSQDRPRMLDEPDHTEQPSGENPSTPKLQPVKSPTLPLPSPFPAEAAQSLSAALSAAAPSYTANSLFGALGSAATVIERRRLSDRVSQSQLQPPKPASLPPPRHAVVSRAPTSSAAASAPKVEAMKPLPEPLATEREIVDLTDDGDEDEDGGMLDEDAIVQETDLNQSFSTTIPDDEMYQDYGKTLLDEAATEKADVRVQDEVTEEMDVDVVPTLATEAVIHLRDDEELLDAEADERIVTEQSRKLEPSAKDVPATTEEPKSPAKGFPDAFSLDGAAAGSPPLRRSPRKRKPSVTASTPVEKLQPGPFTLDGASMSSVSARVTPQSEKERVRKSTYRSLFGLRSPEKDRQSPAVAKLEKEKKEERFIPGWFFEVEDQRQLDGDHSDKAQGQVDSADQQSERHAPDAEASPQDVIMLDDLASDKRKVDGNVESIPIDPRLQQSRASEEPTPSPKLQVIELDASSDIEEDDEPEAGDDTPKPAVQELPSSSPVIQDSLEDSQDETLVVRKDERGARRKEPGHRQPETVAPNVPREASPSPEPSDLPNLQPDAEEHIAPPRSTAANTVLEPERSPESEQFPSSPVIRRERLLSEEAPFQHPNEQQSSTQAPSYPSLPLSPSNSQSLRDMHSQPEVEESVPSRLPPTPQLTQQESSTRAEEHFSQKTPAAKLLRSESFLRAEAKAAESPVTPQTKTPSRRSARLRASNVPHVLSEWFSPRSSGVAADLEKTMEQDFTPAAAAKDMNGTQIAVTHGHTTPSKAVATSILSTGFATAHSYFTPLSKLPELTNPSGQPSALDVLAVITDKTKDPVRAKKGPRDYFTIFCIIDPSLPSSDSIRVEVFRPYKTTLPVPEVGDVVLLRSFAVKSKKHMPYLLSTDASAWCVWHYKDSVEDGKPAWAQKARKATSKEEIKGPPVEFGEEERSRSRDLREWWLSTQHGGLRSPEIADGVKERIAKV